MTYRKTIYVRILAALMGAAAMSGCLKDENLSAGGTNDAGEAMVKLSLNMPGGMATRGMTAVQESTVKSVNVLVFDKDDKLSYMRVGDISVSGSTVSFEALYKVSKNASDKYRLVVFVNSQWKLNSLFGGQNINSHVGKSYAVVMAMLEETACVTYSQWLEEGLPMWGEFEQPVQITPGMTLPAMPVLRSIARIDVGVNPSPSYNADGSAVWAELPNFSLEEVIVYKAGTKYMIAPKFADFDFTAKVVTGINLPASQTLRSSNPKYLVETANRAGGLATGRGIHISSQIYVPETDVNIGINGAYVDANHLNRTAIVVGGKYNGSSQISYYRIDFVRSDDRTKLHDLKRNYCYQAVIKEVIGSGFDDPDDAYKSYVSQIEATINEWNKGTVGVVIDGENKLTLSRDMIFCGNEGSATGPFTSVVKTTNTADGLTITGPFVAGTTSTAAAWVTSPSVSAVADAIDADLGSVKTATISIGQIAAWAGAADREAYFLVKSGNMEYEYRIVQSKDKWITLTPFPDGNCYPMDGGLHSMQAASRILWDVDIKADSGNWNDAITDLHTRSGGRNTAGQGVYFSTINDIDKGLKSESHVKFTYTDRAGVCPDEILSVPVVTGFTVAAANVANCFILNPLATTTTGIYIPVTRANQAIAGSIGEASELASEFVWTDNPAGAYQSETKRQDNASVQYYVRSGKGSTGYLFVQQGKGERNSDGNTVVAIKTKADDIIRWSWHIWTTNYVPSGTIMNRNLGATAYNPLVNSVFNQAQFEKTLGLSYQWGRKDPSQYRLGQDSFGLSASPSYYRANGALRGMQGVKMTALADLIARPIDRANTETQTTYTGSIGRYSWKTAANAKTIYDPCPKGWRVATAGSISASWGAHTNRGRNHSGGIGAGYFPETVWHNTALELQIYIWYAEFDGVGLDGIQNAYHSGISSATTAANLAAATYGGGASTIHGAAVRCIAE